MQQILYIFLTVLLLSCTEANQNKQSDKQEPFILILGVAQDAGYPQIACQKSCCLLVDENPDLRQFVSSIALIDPVSNESWVFDATPDLPEQINMLSKHLGTMKLPDGIFLTHGHIGHYTGLMYLGREALNADKMPVYAMPRMKTFLTENGPWSQLVKLQNIEINELKSDSTLVLNDRFSVTPLAVPHRDEFTETVGFMITGLNKKVLFIPDIDKWKKWDRNIVDHIKDVDIALLDATFYKDGEISRNMNEVPHPFVEESMQLFDALSDADKQKVYFIHFNHTNPLLNKNSSARNEVIQRGYNIAEQGLVLEID